MPNTSITPTDIASRARRTATIIQRLPHIMKQLAEADPWPSVAEVRERLNPTKIEVDFAAVALYVGRHWTPAHQDRLVVQIGKVTDGVRAFIEVFEHCEQTKSRETVSFNRHEGAFFLAVCMMIAKEIAQWAQDIECRDHELPPSEAMSGDMPRRATLAYSSFQVAETRMDTPPETDLEAYDWLQEHPDAIENYILPSYETWSRNLRTARNKIQKQKNKPRSGRSGGSSVVTQHVIATPRNFRD